MATGSYRLVVRSIGVKALKDKLSEYLRFAAAGETVLVTDRDHVIAEIGPPRRAQAESVSDAVVAYGVSSGWITPRQFPPGAVPDLPAARGRLADVLAELDRDREER